MRKSGPGRHYRRGLSLVEITRMFPDEEAAHAYFAGILWPDGPRCPRCGTDNVLSGAKHPTMPYRCRPCRRFFSIKTGTVMEGSKIGLQTWAIAIYLLASGIKGTSSMKLHRDLGVTQTTAWYLAHRIRQAWSAEPEPFSGPVEVDETFVGGKKKNMPKSRRGDIGEGGYQHMAIVVGAKDRETLGVAARVIPNVESHTLKSFVRDTSAPGATVFTDTAGGYRNMRGFLHESVNHSIGEYVRGMAHTNGIESFWALLKRGYYGTYHKMSRKHLARYVDEFAGRHNLRDSDTADQMAAMARGFLGKRLRYADLTA